MDPLRTRTGQVDQRGRRRKFPPALCSESSQTNKIMKPNKENFYENTIKARPPPIPSGGLVLWQLCSAHRRPRTCACEETPSASHRNSRDGRNPGGCGAAIPLGIDGTLAKKPNFNQSAFHPSSWL